MTRRDETMMRRGRNCFRMGGFASAASPDFLDPLRLSNLKLLECIGLVKHFSSSCANLKPAFSPIYQSARSSAKPNTQPTMNWAKSDPPVHLGNLENSRLQR